MSDLRKQLDAAKDEYRSARYPGKLAEELLAGSTGRSSMRLYIGAIGGLAAAAVVGFVLLRPASTTQTSPTSADKPTMVAKLDHPKAPVQTPTTAQASDDSAEDSMSLADLAAMPAFPDDVSISSTPAETSTATTMASNTKASGAATSDTEYLPMVPSPPSMTEMGAMPSLPSMDFGFSDVSDTSGSNKSS